MKKKSGIIAKWGDEINWNQRVKAICKPCWELKYCPYGPLVEDFPLKDRNDERSCRIFGHDCPVFFVAEPLTETKELRRISRSIPRTIQFKVLKRENQICRGCGKSVLDEDIHFDHIIPWSKGGPTEEHNIRLLCADCNRKRGNRFEDEYLVQNFSDHVLKPSEVDYIDIIKMAVFGGLQYILEEDKLPTAQDFADKYTKEDVSDFEHQAVAVFENFHEFFSNKKPENFSEMEFEFLKKRWGFTDNNVYNIRDVNNEFNLDINECVRLDKILLTRIGVRIKDNKSDLKKWERF